MKNIFLYILSDVFLLSVRRVSVKQEWERKRDASNELKGKPRSVSIARYTTSQNVHIRKAFGTDVPHPFHGGSGKVT